jgi:tetratricopeptide (TPR) repeat protein
MKHVFTIILAGLLAAGCQSNKAVIGVHKNLLMPAKFPTMQQTKSLALVSVSGDHEELNNDQMTRQLESFLSNIEVDGKPHFAVLPKSQVDGQRQHLGIAGLIQAEYEISTMIESSVTKNKKCENYEIDNGQKKCTSWGQNRGICNKQVVEFEFTPRITSSSDALVLLNRTYKSKVISSGCGEKYTSYRNEPADQKSKLIHQALDLILKEFHADIAPHRVSTTIHLINEDNSSLSDDHKALFDKALKLAARGKLTEACRMFAQEAPYLSESPAIMYNVGVCWEAQGESHLAKGYYQKAMSLSDLLSEADKAMVAEAIKRNYNSND